MSITKIGISISESQLADTRALLDPKVFGRAVFAAVKRTTQGAATDVRRIVRAETNIQAKYVSRVIKPVMPHGDPPVGQVVISHELVPLIGYGARGSKRSGVRAIVSKGRDPIQLRHAFIATMKSGHRGVFTRSRHLPTKGPGAGNRKLKLTPRGFAGRFAIDEAFGPAVTDLVNVPDIEKSVVSSITERLEKNLNSQIDRFTK
jgi:hypothetical protein